MTSACADGQVTDPITHACITACGPSSGAFTRIDCPRMRYRGQDAPVCVTKKIDGRMRGACCPPGHTDPTDEECVHEGPADEMFRLMKVTWEWCKKDAPTSRPCQVC